MAAAAGRSKTAAASAPEKKAWDVFSVAKAIPDLFVAEKLSPGGHDVVWLQVLWGMTWAASRNPKVKVDLSAVEVKLSYSQIARSIGARGTHATDVVQRMVLRLKKAGIVAVRKEEGKQVQYYRLTPDRWAAAPKYVPPKLAPVVEMPAPDAVEDEDPQVALPGLEHIALATAQARSFKLDAGTVEVRIVNEGVPVDVGRRRRGNALEFVLRSAAAASTPDLQVGGSKLSHSVMCEAFIAAMLKLEKVLAPDLARKTLTAAGWPDVDFLVAKVSDSMRRSAKKGERWTVAYLKTCAADVLAAWPAEKKRRRAVAATKTGPVCRECGQFPGTQIFGWRCVDCYEAAKGAAS